MSTRRRKYIDQKSNEALVVKIKPFEKPDEFMFYDRDGFYTRDDGLSHILYDKNSQEYFWQYHSNGSNHRVEGPSLCNREQDVLEFQVNGKLLASIEDGVLEKGKYLK